MNPRIDELIALAALGELTEADSIELDAAVSADPALAVELAEALTSAAAVQTSAAVEPPARLRASVLGAISGVTQEGPEPTSPALRSVPGGADDGTVSVKPVGSQRRRRFAPLLAAAAVLMLVAGGVLVATNDRDDDDSIAAVIEADDADSQIVTGSIGELELVYSADQDAFVLVGNSIAPAPAGSTYQVWLVKSGSATSVDTFVPDADGSITLRADGLDPTGSTIGITVEPAGGSDVPTMPLVAQSA